MDSSSLYYSTAVVNTQGPELTNTTTTLLVLATFFVALRFLSRHVIGGLYAWDDWVMLFALVFTFGAGGINYAMIASGLGEHASDLTYDQLEQFFKLLLAFECIYVTGVACNKISVLLMYLRIFPSRGFRVTAAIIGASVVGWWLAIVLVCIFQCHPISTAWKPWEAGVCINLRASFIGNAIPNIASDIAILCMPVHQVLKLRVNVMQKALILFMFLLGSFVLFASIYRFTTVMKFDENDTTYTLATACTWCVVETACGAISGCLPTLRPLLQRVSGKFGSIPSTSGAASKPSGVRSHGQTELMTFGGTGGPNCKTTKSKGPFTRLEDDKYGVSTLVTRTDKQEGYTASSDDENPLNQESDQHVRVQRDVEVSSASASAHDHDEPDKYGI